MTRIYMYASLLTTRGENNILFCLVFQRDTVYIQCPSYHNGHLSRDAYTDIEVSATDVSGNVVGVAQVPNITEDDSLSECPSADSSEYQSHAV